MSNVSNKSGFVKPPLTPMEKEKKAEEFLNFAANTPVLREDKAERIFKKEAVKALALRFPKSLAEDIKEISALTGLSINSVCVELLRPAAKLKLKEIKE
jgi:hypothetical protein